MPRPFFLILVFLAVSILAPSAMAEQVYLGKDTDSASLKLTDIAPGDYASIRLDYNVGFSRFGDDEHADGEIAFTAREGQVRVWVGLGNDNVLARVYVDSSIIWERELARQSCWYGCGASGSIEVKLVETCTGQVKVYVGGDQVASFTVNPDVALTVFKDNHASLISQGRAYDCGTQTPVGYNPETPSNMKLAAAAAAVAIVAGVGLALASRG